MWALHPGDGSLSSPVYHVDPINMSWSVLDLLVLIGIDIKDNNQSGIVWSDVSDVFRLSCWIGNNDVKGD